MNADSGDGLLADGKCIHIGVSPYLHLGSPHHYTISLPLYQLLYPLLSLLFYPPINHAILLFIIQSNIPSFYLAYSLNPFVRSEVDTENQFVNMLYPEMGIRFASLALYTGNPIFNGRIPHRVVLMFLFF